MKTTQPPFAGTATPQRRTGPCAAWRGWRHIAVVLAGLHGFFDAGAQTIAPPAPSPPVVCPPVAQPPTAAQTEAGWRDARDRGFLWQIEKDGRSSYLYGTIHVGRREWLFPGREVLGALRASEVVALELDLTQPDLLQALQAGAAARPDEPLPPALAARLSAQLRQACLPDALLTHLAPELLALQLAALSARWDGLDPGYAIDPMLGGLGHALQKTVVSLESVESQLRLLRSTSTAERETGLAQMLSALEAGRLRAMMNRIAGIWAEGRFDELSRHDEWCECMDTAAQRLQMKQLNDDRNPAMAQRIDALHTGGQSVFAAVGSLHMVGPKGLPTLLAQHGYRVRRMEFSR